MGNNNSDFCFHLPTPECWKIQLDRGNMINRGIQSAGRQELNIMDTISSINLEVYSLNLGIRKYHSELYSL